jgi:drug/metabolite transporter (DMT)-like permease
VAYELLVGGVVLVLLGVAAGEDATPASYSAEVWTAWSFLVVFGSVVALTAYNWLLRTTSVSLVATYAYVNPAVAVVLGWAVLGEAVTAASLVAAAVIVAGVVLVVSAERRRDPELRREAAPTTADAGRGHSRDRRRRAVRAGAVGWLGTRSQDTTR